MNLQSHSDEKWVAETLSSLSLEQQVAQLMLPTIAGGDEHVQHLADLIPQIPVGGVFLSSGTAEQHRRHVALLQEASPLPLLVAADLEVGPGEIIPDTVFFPEGLAVGAAADTDDAYLLGKAAALYGRSVGINWTFSPVVDLNINPDNPVTNTRALGDDPNRVIPLAAAVIRGIQEHGMAACAKHFPGDGVDDLDQHTTTSVNSLPLDKWKQLHGRVFSSLYRRGVLTTMVGHIAFPAFDPHLDRRRAPRPATASHRIVGDLLRGELNFDGLIVSDDMNMGGVAGYLSQSERMIAALAAGHDMLLFPNLPDDYHAVLAAVRSGRIPADHIRAAAARVLRLKAVLGLHRRESPFSPEPDAEEKKLLSAAARRIARNALHLVRDFNGLLPLRDLPAGAKVLTVTLAADGVELPLVDEELRRRGYQVEHLRNPHDFHFHLRARNYEAVFVNFAFRATWCHGSVRSIGAHNQIFMHSFYSEHPRAVFTSFGSPYHLRVFHTLPNYINAFSICPESQRAAVAAWFGEIPMNARSPVGNLERTRW